MANFAVKFVVPITKEQYEDIAPELEKLGYKKRCNWHIDGDHLTNNSFNENGVFCPINIERSSFMGDRILLPEFNKDLVLALAAMTVGTNAMPGEYVVGSSGNILKSAITIGGMRKPTTQELINHFTKKTDILAEVMEVLSENRDPSPLQVQRLIEEKGLMFIRTTNWNSEAVSKFFVDRDNLQKLEQGWALSPPREYKMEINGKSVDLTRDSITLEGVKIDQDKLMNIISGFEFTNNEHIHPAVLIGPAFVPYSGEELMQIINTFQNLYRS